MPGTTAPPAPVPTAPARARHNGAPADVKAARKDAERERKETLARLKDVLATFEIVDNGKSRTLLAAEVTRLKTPLGDKDSLKPLTWLLARIRQAIKASETADKHDRRAAAAASCERDRVAFVSKAGNRLTEETLYTDRDGITEHVLGSELLALLTTPVTAANTNLSQILWLIRAVNKSLGRYRGKPRQIPGTRA